MKSNNLSCRSFGIYHKSSQDTAGLNYLMKPLTPQHTPSHTKLQHENQLPWLSPYYLPGIANQIRTLNLLNISLFCPCVRLGAVRSSLGGTCNLAAVRHRIRILFRHTSELQGQKFSISLKVPINQDPSVISQIQFPQWWPHYFLLIMLYSPTTASLYRLVLLVCLPLRYILQYLPFRHPLGFSLQATFRVAIYLHEHLYLCFTTHTYQFVIACFIMMIIGLMSLHLAKYLQTI